MSNNSRKNENHLSESVKATVPTRLSKADIFQSYIIDSTPRILSTLESFRDRYGHWPTKLLLDKEMASALRKHFFTELGWKMLNERLEVELSEAGILIAEDGQGNRFAYDAIFKQTDSPADIWIWGCKVIA